MRDDQAADGPEADRALLAAIGRQERGAFETLVRRHQRLVWHVVQRLVRDPEDTRELAQETFLRVHRALHQFRGDSRLSTWIARVAWTVAVRHLQRQRIELVGTAAPTGDDADDDDPLLPSALRHAADPLDLQAQVADAQLVHRLREQIERLAPLQRLLLTLYHLHETPVGEIAAITGLPEGTVKSHLFRSRRQLRDWLAPQLGASQLRDRLAPQLGANPDTPGD
jgi:RNA polymerase sigma factor (sigma-70 family)